MSPKQYIKFAIAGTLLIMLLFRFMLGADHEFLAPVTVISMGGFILYSIEVRTKERINEEDEEDEEDEEEDEANFN